MKQKIINNFYHLPKAILANIIYGFPTRKLKVIGVTGTDGKTTTVNMIYQILKGAGKRVSMISTINAEIGGKKFDTGFHVTSPDPFTIQKLAKDATGNGDEFLILEVTSHGLDQYRFWGIKFLIGVITNITHEHLDYHRNFENYFKTKLKLIKGTDCAVVNQNLASNLEGCKRSKVITFGLNKGDFNQKEVKLKLKVFGRYNIENALAAMAVSYLLNIPKLQVLRSLEKFEGVSGRMEEISNSRGIKIFIDFAHTPNALEQALIALQSHISAGRLIAVFGCASERDVSKRPIMGRISAKLANITILTNEDPRYEDENKIISEIAKGAVSFGAKIGINLFKEADRQKAILMALSLAKKGDCIGIFGKGHERTMNIKGQEQPWSDFEAVRKAINGF